MDAGLGSIQTSDRPICDLGHFCARAVPIQRLSRFEWYPHPPDLPPLETDNQKALRVLHRSGGLLLLEIAKKKPSAGALGVS
jgi:hypothetical protein